MTSLELVVDDEEEEFIRGVNRSWLEKTSIGLVTFNEEGDFARCQFKSS